MLDLPQWRGFLAARLQRDEESDDDAGDWGDPAEVDYALVWKPEPGVLGTFSNLKAILRNHPGGASVFLTLSDNGDTKVLKLGDDHKVEPRSALSAPSDAARIETRPRQDRAVVWCRDIAPHPDLPRMHAGHQVRIHVAYGLHAASERTVVRQCVEPYIIVIQQCTAARYR